jgi:predicted  nucleic acid-binding Zn ribbon protein
MLNPCIKSNSSLVAIIATTVLYFEYNHTQLGGDTMCPRCDADMEEIAVDFYHEGIVIHLFYEKCPDCELIQNASIQFVKPTVH